MKPTNDESLNRLLKLDRDAVRESVHRMTDVELATEKLEGLVPLLRLKLDDDVMSLVDEHITRILMAKASWYKFMEAQSGFRQALYKKYPTE